MKRFEVTDKFIRLPAGTMMQLSDKKASKLRPFIKEFEAPGEDLEGMYEAIKPVGFKRGEQVKLVECPKGYEKVLQDIDKPEVVEDSAPEVTDEGGGNEDDQDQPDRIEKMGADELKLDLKERGISFNILTGAPKLRIKLREAIAHEAEARAIAIGETVDSLDADQDFDADGNPSMEAINTVLD